MIVGNINVVPCWQTGAAEQVQFHHWEVGGESQAPERGAEAAQLHPSHVRDGRGGGQTDGHRQSALHCQHIGRAEIMVGTRNQPRPFSPLLILTQVSQRNLYRNWQLQPQTDIRGGTTVQSPVFKQRITIIFFRNPYWNLTGRYQKCKFEWIFST